MDQLSHDFVVPDIRRPGQSLLREQVFIPLTENGRVTLITVGECVDLDGRKYTVQLRIAEMSSGGNIRLYAPDSRSVAAPHIILTPSDNGPPIPVYSYDTESDRVCRIDSGTLLGFKIALRVLSEDLILQVTANNLPHLIKKNPPPVDSETFLRLSAVYRDDTFLEFYNPDHHYDESCTFEPFDSIFGGLFRMKSNARFANVIGSSDDPHVSGTKSWIGLWRREFGEQALYCASWQFQGFDCDKHGPYGGHVIKGKIASKVKEGADHVAFIIPICPSHNNDNSTFMAPLDTADAVWLDHYFRKK